MIIKAYTDTGMRSENQDSYWVGKLDSSGVESVLAGVFDGMGGLYGGAQASESVAKTIDNIALDGNNVLNDEAILSGLTSINTAIRNYSKQRDVHSGTTCTLLAASQGGYRLHHVGDSRCYKVARYGTVVKLTEDHTAFTKYVKSGDLVKSERGPLFKGEIQTEEQMTKLKSTLTRAIGVKTTAGVVTYTGKYNHGDAFLLASDGFWHYLESVKDWGRGLQKAFEDEASGKGTVEGYLRKLADHFKIRGEMDNLTVVVVKL